MRKKIEKNIHQEGTHSFRVRMMVNSHRLDKVLDTLAEARVFRDSHKLSQSLDVHESAVIESRIKKQSIKGLSVGDALDRYLLEITPSKKGADTEEYRIGKAKRMKLAQKPFHGVVPGDVIEYMNEIGGSENNQRKYVSIISHLYHVAIKKWNLPVTNPVAGKIDLPSNGKPRLRRLKKGEHEKLMKALSGESKLFVIIAIETAMRRSEIFGLRWEHINKKDCSAVLNDTKNGESRTTLFSMTAMAVLDELGWRDDGDVWTISERQLRHDWEAAREDIGAPDLHFHDLRHEGTSRLFARGLNIFEVQSITGHKTLEELRKYTHLTPSDTLKKLNAKVKA